MQQLLRRYRDLTVLAVVVLSQLVLLGSQVRGEQDVPLLRQWAVSAVVPFARVFTVTRDATVGSVRELFVLLNARTDNRRLKAENDRLKLENQFLKSELGTADRAKTLAAFQQRSPSRMLAARLIGSGLGTNTKTIFVDRGAKDGVKKGMAVITPDGIVGKVVAAFPAASQVMLVTDPSFAAGVISGKARQPGTLRGNGTPSPIVDYVPTEAKIERGDWFYTSGDDRVFPRGLPVGQISSSARGRDFRDLRITPSGIARGIEEVLVVLDGVHEMLPGETTGGTLPAASAAGETSQLLAEPPGAAVSVDPTAAPTPALRTDADRVLDRYRKIGAAQGHQYGSGRTPDFNLPLTNAAGAAPPRTGAAPPQQ
jgi:rod shape-determining protein MreC